MGKNQSKNVVKRNQGAHSILFYVCLFVNVPRSSARNIKANEILKRY